MKILNLYAGIGGNRKLWENVDVTAVEYNEDIARIYQDFFPDDTVIVADAHKYLLEHYDDGWDFIWASPPCQTHSMCNHFLKGQGIIRYPDMKLWQEIILLRQHCKNLWAIENVKPYYKPQFKAYKSGRHYFWSNFYISNLKLDTDIETFNRKASKEAQRKAIIREAQIPELIDLCGLKDFDIPNKRQVLRNCVNPKLGNHILECARAKIENRKIEVEQMDLFI